MGGLPPTGTISRRCPAPAAVPPLSSLASPSVAVAHERCRLLRGGGARGPELRGRGPPPGRRAVRHRGGGGGGLHWHLPSGERRVPPDRPGDRPSARHPRGGGRDRPPRWVWSPAPAPAAHARGVWLGAGFKAGLSSGLHRQAQVTAGLLVVVGVAAVVVAVVLGRTSADE